MLCGVNSARATEELSMHASHPVRIPTLSSAVLAIVFAGLALPACGPEGSSQDPLSVNTWATGDELPLGNSLFGGDDEGAVDTGDGDSTDTVGDKSSQDTVTNGAPVGFYISHDQLDFGDSVETRSFIVANFSTGSIPFQISSDEDWLVVGISSGAATSTYERIDLTVDRDGLSPGEYFTDLSIITGLGTYMIGVTMDVPDPSGSSLDEPQMYVSEDQLDFSSTESRRIFFVRNTGARELRYSIISTVDWATVNPASGASSGEFDQIGVNINRQQIPDGPQFATILVRATNGQSHAIQLIDGLVADPAPDAAEAVISTESIDFGDSGTARAFTLHNNGGGELEYAIAGGADWLRVDPRDGLLATETDTIDLLVDRNSLNVGRYETTLTVHSTGGSSRTIQVAVTKPLTNPVIIPWLEISGEASEEQIDHCVAGLELWQRLTDTAIISTEYPGAHLFPILQARVPGMRIIPGMKTVSRLDHTNLDSLERWALVAEDVNAFVAASGESTIVFENETAQKAYLDGDYEIDYDQYEACVAQLPDDVEYYWYPSIACHHQNESWLLRTRPLVERVEAAVPNVRFIETSFGDPDWPYYWPSLVIRETVEEISDTIPLPIIYFGCDDTWCYWPYDETAILMGQLQEEGRPDAIFYPGISRWLDAPVQINDQLWPPLD